MVEESDENGADDMHDASEPSAFVAVVDAIDLGDLATALKLLAKVHFMDKHDVELLRDLMDDNKDYAAIHPYRLDLKSRTGAGNPAKPFFARAEEERSIANAVRSQLSEGKNFKTAVHSVHLGRGLA